MARFALHSIHTAENSSYFVLLLAGWLLLTPACSIQPGISVPPEQHPAIPGHALPEAVRNEIQKLLQEADRAIANDRLTTPVDDNAWYRYLRVLALDPDNPSALQGISDIVEKYLNWAIQDIEAGYLHKARNYLAKVSAIDDTHPNLAAVQQRLAEQENTRQQIVALSVYELDHKTNMLSDKLIQLGTQIQQHNARIMIIARNDAEGRWIYQQLNSAVGGTRIHARIKLDSTPTLKIFYTR